MKKIKKDKEIAKSIDKQKESGQEENKVKINKKSSNTNFDITNSHIDSNINSICVYRKTKKHSSRSRKNRIKFSK